jgi:hypothetical protein
MKSAFIRVLGVAGLVLLAGCAGREPPPPPASGLPAGIDPKPHFIADLPEGRLPPLPEPEAAAPFLAEAETTKDYEQRMAAYRKAAELGSPEAQYSLARMQDPPDFNMLIDLAKRGYGRAAWEMRKFSLIGSHPNLRQHAPYWLNIAARSADPMFISIWNKTLDDYRARGDIPESTGDGLYFDTAFVLKGNISNSGQGVPLEYKTIYFLYPGWTFLVQSFVPMDNKFFDVLEFVNNDGQRVKVYFDITTWAGQR